MAQNHPFRRAHDFGPDEMIKRTYIFDTIKSVFRTYGFLPLETPAMETSTLLENTATRATSCSLKS